MLEGVKEYNLYIFDRFGGIIFETRDQTQGWDGQVNENEFALVGHYAYAIRIIDFLGKKRNFTGSITLIR